MKIPFRILIGVILLSATVLCDGCLVNPCESTSEPSLIVSFFSNGQSKAYSKAFSLDGKVKFDFISNYVKLPLSLNDDRLTYIFLNNAVSDTLSISYQRNFKFQSTECGFTVSLENMAIIKPTSFKDFSSPYVSDRNRGEYAITVYE